MQAEEDARKAEVHAEDAPGAEAAPDSSNQRAGLVEAGAPAPQSQASAPEPPAQQRSAFERALNRFFRDFTRRSDRFLDYLAVDDPRRRRASIVLAIAVNIIIYTSLAVFGRFEIWIPAAPRDSISVSIVNLPPEPVFPELRDPEKAPEPAPEPEIVEKPEIEPKPAPTPTPKPKPKPEPEIAPAPETQEAPPAPEPELAEKPKPEPTPTIDLTPEPQFAPPAEDEVAPFVAEPAPKPSDEILLPEPETSTEPAPPAEEVPEQQAPAEEAPPLVEPAPPADEAPNDIEVTSNGDDESEKEKEKEGESAAPVAEEAAPPPVAQAKPSGDDVFDEAPTFARPPPPLPGVNLPKGEVAAAPGQSGVVAIYCPEEFSDKEKAAECAGRTEIRSGWRPGKSGEDWSEAARLLKQDRAAGRAGTDPSAIYGPREGGAIKDAEAVRELKDFRRSVDSINNPAGANSTNLNDTLGQPSIGPDEYNPSWTLKDDPNVSQKDLKQLEKDLDEAQKARQPKKDDGGA